MKTIRHNAFETNSSSSHALTVCSANINAKPDTTFIPDENNAIRIVIGSGFETPSVLGKATLMLTYAHTIGDQSKYDRVVAVIEDMTKATVNVVEIALREWQKDSRTYKVEYKPAVVPEVVSKPKDDEDNEDGDDDEDESVLDDLFYTFTCEYGHGDATGFAAAMAALFTTDDHIKAFIFNSSHYYGIEGYYDG